MSNKSTAKDGPLGLASVQKLVEGVIKHAPDHPGNPFSYVRKMYFPQASRNLYYDFYSGATGRQYESGDLQMLATREGANLLRRNTALFGALTEEHMLDACEKNGISGSARAQYLDVDFAMDRADRIRSGRRQYLKFVGRTASPTQPADRQHFNSCNGTGGLHVDAFQEAEPAIATEATAMRQPFETPRRAGTKATPTDARYVLSGLLPPPQLCLSYSPWLIMPVLCDVCVAICL